MAEEMAKDSEFAPSHADSLIPPVNPNPRPSPRNGLIPPVEHQFRPGHPNVSGGRPKGSSILGPFLRRLARNPDEDGFGAEAKALADKLYDALLDAEPKRVEAIAKILDRTDGPVRKEIEHSGSMASSVTFIGVDTATSREENDPPLKALSEAQRALPAAGEGQGEGARSADRERAESLDGSV